MKSNYFLVYHCSYSYYRYKGYPDHTISVEQYNLLK